MTLHPDTQAALHALDRTKGNLNPSRLDELRTPLADGERALFDRAVELRREFDDLHERVMGSATLAEASLGTAAFIHELRQCLAPLVGLSELMKETPGSPCAAEWAAEISSQARRVADLLDQRAALLRTPGNEEEPCDLAKVVAEAAAYFTRLPPGVHLSAEVPADLPRAIARRRQLLHAVINLLANARDAHRDRPGTIRIGAGLRGEKVEIVVTDQGAGIDPRIREHLFEPLFTTKGKDGTGLGLFLSRELLQPGGELSLVDAAEVPAGARTAFAIRLRREGAPVIAAPPPAAPAAAPSEPWAAARDRARSRISSLVTEERNNPVLLVEDEPAVRRMTRAVLESVANIKIYEAADAAFALKLLEKVEVDFLICDKNLPDQDGLEVIRQAKQRYPAIDAMVVTGYPSPDSVAEAIRVGATDYLLKPVRHLKEFRDDVASALVRQKLRRLAHRHGSMWRETARALKAEAPAGDAFLPALDAVESLFSRNEEPLPPRVATLGPEELDTFLAAAGIQAVKLRTAAELGTAGDELDLVVFAAEISPDEVRELTAAARSVPRPPHLVGVGRYLHTETAVAAIHGRTTAMLDATLGAAEIAAHLTAAAERRRTEVRVEALRAFFEQLGLPL